MTRRYFKSSKTIGSCRCPVEFYRIQWLVRKYDRERRTVERTDPCLLKTDIVKVLKIYRKLAIAPILLMIIFVIITTCAHRFPNIYFDFRYSICAQIPRTDPCRTPNNELRPTKEYTRLLTVICPY